MGAPHKPWAKTAQKAITKNSNQGNQSPTTALGMAGGSPSPPAQNQAASLLASAKLTTDSISKSAITENNRLELILRGSWNKSYAWIYGNLLALPSLLRAFESFTSDYGRLHFSQGPLWHLGRGFGWLAAWLETPLRWARPPLKLVEPSDAEFIRDRLLTPLGLIVYFGSYAQFRDAMSLQRV